MEQYINTLYKKIVCEKLETNITIDNAVVYHRNTEGEFKIQNFTNAAEYIILPQLQITKYTNCIVFPLVEWENDIISNIHVNNTLIAIYHYSYDIVIKISRDQIIYYIKRSYNENYHLVRRSRARFRAARLPARS